MPDIIVGSYWLYKGYSLHVVTFVNDRLVIVEECDSESPEKPYLLADFYAKFEPVDLTQEG